jgi:hypothetical protein
VAGLAIAGAQSLPRSWLRLVTRVAATVLAGLGIITLVSAWTG